MLAQSMISPIPVFMGYAVVMAIAGGLAWLFLSTTGPHKNAAGAASFFLAAVGCVPVVPSLLAICLGIVGIRRGRDSKIGGGIAMAGLIAGSIGLLFWGIVLAPSAYQAIEDDSVTAATQQFITDIDQANSAAALPLCAGIPASEIQSAVRQVGKSGAPANVVCTEPEMLFDPFGRMDVSGYVHDNDRIWSFDVQLDKHAGTYKVVRFSVNP